MIRKLLGTTVAVAGLLSLVGVPTANAVTLPAGDGQVNCGIGGTVRVVRPIATPSIAKVVVAGKIAGCTYNGNAIPFVTGATRSVVVSNPAAVCAALADGTAYAKTTITVKVNGTLYTTAVVKVEVSVSPSSPGSLVEASGTTTINSVGLTAQVAAQTNRPVGDLCTGASVVNFLGTASLAWDRP